MIEQRIFDYRGFNDRGSWLKNKIKSLIGKGDSKEEILKRRKQLIEYYKLHPRKLYQKGTSESKESFNKKLDNTTSKVVSRRVNDLDKAIKSTGSTYTPGSATKTAIKYTAPIALVPIPGTTAVPIAAIGAGSIIDKVKMARLNRYERVKSANSKLKELKKEIELADRDQFNRKKLILAKRKKK